MQIEMMDRIYEALLNRTPETPQLGWHDIKKLEEELGISYGINQIEGRGWYAAYGDVRMEHRFHSGTKLPSYYGIRLRRPEGYPLEVEAQYVNILKAVYLCEKNGIPATAEAVAPYAQLASSTVRMYLAKLKYQHVECTRKEYSLRFPPDQKIWVWQSVFNGFETTIEAFIALPVVGATPLPPGTVPKYVIEVSIQSIDGLIRELQARRDSLEKLLGQL